MKIKIGNKYVGDGEPVYVIAEVGINHQGDLNTAKRLIDVAGFALADAVKFQKRTIDKILTKKGLEQPYTGENSFGKTYGEHRKALEISRENFYELKNYADGKNLTFLASGWDEESIDLLDELGVPAFKVPSADVTNIPLLKHTAKKGRPILLSTGMSDMKEVEEAVETITKYNKNLIILQCTGTYPCKFENINLNVLKTYREKFGLLVGYSGHELGISVPVIAAMHGACVIERHITLDRAMKGGDHAAALEPDGLSKVVRDIKRIPIILGSLEKKLLDAEVPVRKKLAKSLVSKVRIPKGTEISQDMLCVKGPGCGLPPKYYYAAEGAVALKDIEEDVVIKEGDIKLKDDYKDKK